MRKRVKQHESVDE